MFFCFKICFRNGYTIFGFIRVGIFAGILGNIGFCIVEVFFWRLLKNLEFLGVFKWKGFVRD